MHSVNRKQILFVHLFIFYFDSLSYWVDFSRDLGSSQQAPTPFEVFVEVIDVCISFNSICPKKYINFTCFGSQFQAHWSVLISGIIDNVLLADVSTVSSKGRNNLCRAPVPPSRAPSVDGQSFRLAFFTIAGMEDIGSVEPNLTPRVKIYPILSSCQVKS